MPQRLVASRCCCRRRQRSPKTEGGGVPIRSRWGPAPLLPTGDLCPRSRRPAVAHSLVGRLLNRLGPPGPPGPPPLDLATEYALCLHRGFRATGSLSKVCTGHVDDGMRVRGRRLLCCQGVAVQPSACGRALGVWGNTLRFSQPCMLPGWGGGAFGAAGRLSGLRGVGPWPAGACVL